MLMSLKLLHKKKRIKIHSHARDFRWRSHSFLSSEVDSFWLWILCASRQSSWSILTKKNWMKFSIHNINYSSNLWHKSDLIKFGGRCYKLHYRTMRSEGTSTLMVIVIWQFIKLWRRKVHRKYCVQFSLTTFAEIFELLWPFGIGEKLINGKCLQHWFEYRYHSLNFLVSS